MAIWVLSYVAFVRGGSVHLVALLHRVHTLWGGLVTELSQRAPKGWQWLDHMDHKAIQKGDHVWLIDISANCGGQFEALCVLVTAPPNALSHTVFGELS